MTESQAMRPEDVIDLGRYPIAGDGPARDALIARLKADLDARQYCVLPDFLRPQAIAKAVAQAKEWRYLAYDNNSRRNCYLQRKADPSLPGDHPRNIMLEASTRMMAYDLLPADSPLKAFYHWEPARRMVAAITGVERLYDNEDPYQPANVLCYERGDQSAWHFDSVNAFTMTLMLQAPEAGGEFEIVPNTRSDDDQNYDYVRSVLKGERPGDAVKVARSPGALCIFRGCNSLHRVSRIEGDAMRIMGVFVYETEPGVIGDREVNETVYGPRVAATMT